MSQFRFLIVSTVILGLAGYAFGINFAYKSTPPGGLAATNVPQFVVIGSDDNVVDSGVNWIVDFLADKTNPAGQNQAATYDAQKVLMSFYLVGYAADSLDLSSPDIVAAWKKAYAAGHEIGNHTYDHILDLTKADYVERNGYALNTDAWYQAITQGDTAIAKALGIPFDSIPIVIKGFRTPRLQYNDSTFLAVQQRGFRYDCSIEEGYEDGEIGTPNQRTCGSFYWPFTLDNGSQSDKLNELWWKSDPVGWTFISCGKVPGLWEVPVYCWILPDSTYSVANGGSAYLRDSAAAHCEWLADSDYKVTGFDYNLLAIYENGSYAMDSADYYVTMQYNFDECLKANRRPFNFNIHTDQCFTDTSNTEDNPNITPLQRRQCIENVINYMLTKPEVRFVTASQLLDWMEAPVGLDGTIGVPIRHIAQNSKRAALTVKGISQGKFVFNAPVQGTYSVRLFNANGAMVQNTMVRANQAGVIAAPLTSNLGAGFYMAHISAPTGVYKVRCLSVE